MDQRMLDTMDDAFKLFDRIGNRFFRATFIKRDSTIRHMVARQHVKKYTKGGTLAYEPRAKGLLPVYDVQHAGYRMVAVDRLLWVQYAGIRYVARWTMPEASTPAGEGYRAFLDMARYLAP